MNTYKTFGIYQGKQNSLFEQEEYVPIDFRPEQEDAIVLALNHFCLSAGHGKTKTFTPRDKFRQFLWNAKMRFGKTLCALELAKRMEVKRTLIVTHRPVVDKGWHEDFKKIFHDTEWEYGTRTDEEGTGDFPTLTRIAEQNEGKFIFFVSMQYLRRSTLVGGDNDEQLKKDILKTDWDLVVVDEAHEGTRTTLGKQVIDNWLTKERTKVLHLSGTPFNLYEDFEDNEIYTWDYIKEQRAKSEWPETHPGEFNPYAELPRMNILTYNLGDLLQSYIQEGQEFKFKDFFRVWTGNPRSDGKQVEKELIGRFVHEEDVNAFLDLLCKKDEESNFPFSTDEYRNMFRHTLWVLPGVKEAKAMKALLEKHRIFAKPRFKVINVAGEGDNDESRSNALDQVLTEIGGIPERTSTITLSCGRLTTGVTVKPWTAVFYLKGSDTTSPATYMQTIFRVQSPYVNNDGKMKTECYVFDFLPNRMLNAITETAKFASLTQKEKRKASITDTEQDKENITEFLRYCNVISLSGGKMSPYDAETLFKRLHEVYIDRLVRRGFDDQCLYVQEELNKIDPDLINHIGTHGGKAPDENREKAQKNGPVDISQMTPEQRAKWEENVRKKKAEAKKRAEEKASKDEEFRKKWESWTEEERQNYLRDEAEKAAKREEARKQREEFRKRITNIRGIALRIPLLMYGGADAGDTSVDLTVENFTRKIKDESWVEFMPKGITKEDFNKIKKCFNATRFEEAGKRIRSLAREADEMHVLDRIERITWIFSTFHNPDKETVLTPWRVVNMHMSGTLGGYCFFNERFDGPNQKEVPGEDGKLFDYIDTNEPRFVQKEDITNQVFCKIDEGKGIASHVLEINSKTGLYPLYVTYSMYRKLLEYYDIMGLLDNPKDNLSIDEEQAIWDDIVAKNVYVICNTPMAAGITRRTLMGFREQDKKLNIKSDKLIERAKDDQEALIKQIKSVGYWNGTTSKAMINFDAVVGNPPYQETSNVNNRQNPIYHYFYNLAESLSDIYTLISPARFLFNAGLTPADWNQKMLSDTHLKVAYYTSDSTTCFPNTAINGGIVIILRDVNKSFNPITLFLPDENLRSIASKFDPNSENSIKHKVYGGRSDLKFNNVFLQQFPNSPQDRLSFIQAKRPAVTVLGPNEEYELKTSTFAALPYAFESKVNNTEEYYHLLGLENSRRVWKYTKRIYMSPRYPENNNIESYKVFISKADGAAGQVGNPIPARIIGKSELGRPGDSATSSFISIGSFGSEIEAINCAIYLRTKFVRCLIGILKITQDNPPSVWAYVPMQDFTSASDIDWSKPIEQIDSQLYAKYKLDNKEINFIESMIAPLD